jgi:hypothetical protein
MTPAGEAELSARLRAEIPDLRFIDGQVWPTSDPPLAHGIEGCSSGLAYLWSPSAVPNLPTVRSADGRTRGPASGVVIQCERGSFDGDDLLSGGLSVGWSAPEVGVLVDQVWSITRSMTRPRIVALDGSTSPYRASDDAVAWVRAAGHRRFGANNSYVRYLPVEVFREREEAVGGARGPR